MIDIYIDSKASYVYKQLANIMIEECRDCGQPYLEFILINYGFKL